MTDIHWMHAATINTELSAETPVPRRIPGYYQLLNKRFSIYPTRSRPSLAAQIQVETQIRTNTNTAVHLL